MSRYFIILAADLESPEDVLTLVRTTGRIVDGVKIAAATLIRSGADLVKRVRDLVGDRPVLVDLKIADIGFSSKGGWHGTNAKLIHALAGSGASHVTVHGFPGPVSVAESVLTAKEEGIKVLLLPMMSHAGAELFFSRPVEAPILREATARAGLNPDFHPDSHCRDITDAILMLGEALGVYGYIGPATRPDVLKRYRSMTSRPVWCPGFGRQDRLGRSLEDQFRKWMEIVGPESAAIVGSAIFKADDPAEAAREIIGIRDRVTEESLD